MVEVEIVNPDGLRVGWWGAWMLIFADDDMLVRQGIKVHVVHNRSCIDYCHMIELLIEIGFYWTLSWRCS